MRTRRVRTQMKDPIFVLTFVSALGHTIINGTFIIECDGHLETLGSGTFNFMPSKMTHEAWTKPDEGALLFITMDRSWDINWVAGPPKPAGGLKDP